jgi:hypothetical protein
LEVEIKLEVAAVLDQRPRAEHGLAIATKQHPRVFGICNIADRNQVNRSLPGNIRFPDLSVKQACAPHAHAQTKQYGSKKLVTNLHIFISPSRAVKVNQLRLLPDISL